MIDQRTYGFAALVLLKGRISEKCVATIMRTPFKCAILISFCIFQGETSYVVLRSLPVAIL